MITSIVRLGETTTANKLAMEMAHQFGTYSINGFKSILETNGLKLTYREKLMVVDHLMTALTRITKLFSSGGLSFDAEKAKTYIVHQLNTGVEQNG
ncbi:MULTISPECIES: hypothetical protein [Klebsiella]|jgi:hypothetical protein|uniref:hypothetical protein n=1 Tax=Klebsiella TaxID=570 RepID=UPI0006653A3D|nr:MULTISPECIES: hypothetical protein [Klebsiella]QBL52261.1 hypothetical protein BMD99_027845 [Klebsiella sp. PO552]QLT68278.1 hypothetical protein HV202_31430 [Klebsiella oxytoca]DAL48338.1 MAG TPA_asm: hypothetical protein [Caudoviricetes sp.]HCA4366114.1 hypothetical protein [Klebsiella variicola subsp. variicola]HCI6032479.1 hypothetical protein [Klebsiella quasipneumoniae subsp. quasipneumoniae]HDU3818682.1 hypothetical protein [Klebsiella pneumoniae subsp. pneumoniae]